MENAFHCCRNRTVLTGGTDELLLSLREVKSCAEADKQRYWYLKRPKKNLVNFEIVEEEKRDENGDVSLQRRRDITVFENQSKSLDFTTLRVKRV